MGFPLYEINSSLTLYLKNSIELSFVIASPAIFPGWMSGIRGGLKREAVRGEYERRSENIDISQGTLSTVDDYNYSLHFPHYISPVCERNDRWPEFYKKLLA